jgi:hypothetical protein
LPEIPAQKLSCQKNQNVNTNKPIHYAVIPVAERPPDYVHGLRIEIEGDEVNRYPEMKQRVFVRKSMGVPNRGIFQ